MDLKNTFLLYIVFLIILYLWKPHIFKLSNSKNKKRKLLYLIFLVVILSIISFYIKVLNEWFF